MLLEKTQSLGLTKCPCLIFIKCPSLVSTLSGEGIDVIGIIIYFIVTSEL